MLPYFFLLAIVMLVLSPSSNRNSTIRLSDLSIIVSIMCLTLFAGFRSLNVGTDTGNYVYYFDNLANDGDTFNTGNLEVGFVFLERFALWFSSDYWSLLISVALLSVTSYVYTMQKLSSNIRLSIFIFITLGIYLFFFNGARQGIAVAIISVSVIFIIREKLIGFFTCVLVASLFHRTALIMLPFYFILRRPYSTKNLILYTIIGLISFASISNLTSLLSESLGARYEVYQTRDETGGLLLSLFFIVLFMLLLFLRKQIASANLKLFDIYLNLCLFNSLVYIIVLVTGSDVNFIRLSNYFSVGIVMIWPIIFKDTRFFRSAFGKTFFVIIHLLFFGIYIFKMSNLNPYVLNPAIF